MPKLNYTMSIPEDKKRDFHSLCARNDYKMSHVILGFIDTFIAWEGRPKSRGDFISVLRDRASSYRTDTRLRQGNRK